MSEPNQAVPSEDHPSFMFAMGQLAGQVAALSTAVDRLREELSVKYKDLDDRVGTLERTQWTSHAKVSIVASIITFVLTSGVEYVILRLTQTS